MIRARACFAVFTISSINFFMFSSLVISTLCLDNNLTGIDIKENATAPVLSL